jgi:hypothetical protein
MNGITMVRLFRSTPLTIAWATSSGLNRELALPILGLARGFLDCAPNMSISRHQVPQASN